MEGSGRSHNYPGMGLEGLRKITKILRVDGLRAWDFNPGTPEHEAGAQYIPPVYWFHWNDKNKKNFIRYVDGKLHDIYMPTSIMENS
jgi:hypothetical protein